MNNNGKLRGNLAVLGRRETLERTLRWSLIMAVGATALVMSGVVLAGLLQGQSPDSVRLLVQAGVVYALAFGVLLPIRLWRQSRPLQEASFAAFGFFATFFGLAMLVVFFVQLSYQTFQWFRNVPMLVQHENARLEAQREQATLLSNGLLPAEERARIESDMADELARAGSEEEKKELRELFEKEIIPSRIKDLKPRAADLAREADLGIRSDTSPIANIGYFLLQGPSNKPQDAGIYPALLGSILLALITILFAVPVGVGAALYLEEYRSQSRFGSVIQININNLAGVPSIVFGILGAFLFVELLFKPISQNQSLAFEQLHRQLALDPDAHLGWWERLQLAFHTQADMAWWQRILVVLPAIAARNVLGGGLTLGLLTLPVVIVAAQEAIRAVPKSIRQGAYALGATQWQVIWHQVLPVARPGILTGTILALSRAIGEAAALVFFGALLFVNEEPSLFSRFTLLPMQIFGWADRPAVTVDGATVEIWHYNAAVASLVLLAVLLSLNGLAIYLRNRAQKQTRW